MFEQGEANGNGQSSSADALTPQASDWTRISDHHRYARAQQHERQVLNKLGALLEFMDDPGKVGTIERMNFMFRLRLAISGTSVWDDIESLIYTACREYPVW